MTLLGRRVLIGLAVLSVLLLALVMRPFFEALLLAAVLAAAFSPWYERLARKLGQRRTLAGGLFILAIVFALVLPIVGIALAIAQQAEDAIAPARTAYQTGGVNGVIDSLPAPLPSLVREGLARLPKGGQQVEDLARTAAGRILSGVGTFFVTTGNIFFQLSMMLVALFFLLVDGPALVRWLVEISPLTSEQMDELLLGFRDVSTAVLAGSVGTAFIQTCVALVGFWLAGAPHALLLATATFIAAFIPVMGAGALVTATAVVLFLTGNTGAAAFLAFWGLGVVSSIDNFVKPVLMRGRLEVNTGVTFFALLGGISAFGPVGMLLGPLIVAFFLAVVRMCQKELGTPLPEAPAAAAVTAAASDGDTEAPTTPGP